MGLDQAWGKAAPAKGPEASAREREVLHALQETVAPLPGPYRAVVELRCYLELTTAETAGRLKISRSNVSNRLHRALDLIRRRFVARIKDGQRVE